VVDDERLYAQAIAREIRRQGIACDTAFTAAEALERFEREAYSAVLLDHRLPDDDGIRLVPVLLARRLGCTVFVMTAHQAIPNAIQAIRLGAEDYLVKGTSIQPLVNAVVAARRRSEVRSAGTDWDAHERDGLLGTSGIIARAREQLQRVSARKDTTVLLTGETGVGKEVAARYLHARSAGVSTPFIALDCVALPSTLVESLLFGHEKGAFTGADRARDGAFCEAGEGTIFLDEIGEMDLSLQGKLLRVLESRRFARLGSVKELPVRARVVAATNRDLMEQVRKGEFRFDLYQRLSVFPIGLPPLRDRGEDVLILARHFLRFFAEKASAPAKTLAAEAERALAGYDFPGNVRELKNLIERAIILCDGPVVELRHLPERILRRDGMHEIAPQRPSGGLPVDFVPGVDTLAMLESRMVDWALARAGGVKAEAAKILGISRFQLLRKLQKHGKAAKGDRHL
jgi:DNA-binding NtrC family response regulator